MRQKMRIVVGIDGSPGSVGALDWALREAKAHGVTEIDAVMAWHQPTGWAIAGNFGVMTPPPDDLYNLAQTQLHNVVDITPVPDGITINPVVQEGNAAEILLSYVTELDHLVVGSDGHSRIADMLRGSVTQQIVGHAPCTATVVPSHKEMDRSGHEGPITNEEPIVVGVDGSEHSRRALGMAIDEALAHNRRVVAVWVWTEVATDLTTGTIDMPPADALESAAKGALKEFLDSADVPEGVELHGLVVEGHPSTALLGQSRHAARLVVGSRGHGGFAGLVLGSVSRNVALHATCPVTIVP